MRKNKITLVYISTGILDTVFDSQVLPLLREMKTRGIQVVHFSLEPFLGKRTKVWQEKVESLKAESFKTVFFRKLPELSKWVVSLDAYRIRRLLRKLPPPVIVHARGHVNAWKVSFPQRNWSVFADLRGAVWDEKANTEPSFFQKMRWKSTKDFFLDLEKDLVSHSEKVSCVSNVFKQHLLSHGPSDITVMPTFVDEESFRYNPKARQEIREKYCLKNRPVFIFSAGGAIWQMTSQLIRWCASVSKILPESFFIILSHVPEQVSTVASQHLTPDNFIVKKVPYSEVGKYLSAADIGLLFRDGSSWTNRVAAPTKFSEYACAGLPVCLSGGIGDTEEYVKLNKQGVVISTLEEVPELKKIQSLLTVNREELSQKGIAQFGRLRWMEYLENEYYSLANNVQDCSHC